MFLDQYLKINDIKTYSYKTGYLPLLLAFNKNSKSTPSRMVQCPNRQVMCKTGEIGVTGPLGNNQLNASLDQETNVKNKSLSYNECIKDYDLSLLTPNKITVNHLLTMAPIFVDVSDAFGHIILHPDTALSC